MNNPRFSTAKRIANSNRSEVGALIEGSQDVPFS
jgi:hypothetical protein